MFRKKSINIVVTILLYFVIISMFVYRDIATNQYISLSISEQIMTPTPYPMFFEYGVYIFLIAGIAICQTLLVLGDFISERKNKKNHPNGNMDSLNVGLSSAVKSLDVPCILYNQYNLMRGQMLVVKEMPAPNVIGGIIYDTEMELVEIRKNHIILQDRKGTSSLTGGVTEYCFHIDEIGKSIFPK